MKLVYIDEAGNTGTKLDPDQPIHMLGALLVPEDKVRSTEEEIRSVAVRHLGVAAVDPGIELHGHHIRSGKGPFKHMNVPARIALVEDLLAILSAHQIEFGYIAIRKAELKLKTSKHPHELAFMFLVERLQDVLQRDGDLALLIADEQHEMEDRLIANLDVYKRQRTNWGYRPTAINNIVDSIHFVKSRNNLLIQLADVVTSLALRQMKSNDQLMLAWANTKPRNYNFPDWCKANASKAQLADLALVACMPRTCFTKVYP